MIENIVFLLRCRWWVCALNSFDITSADASKGGRRQRTKMAEVGDGYLLMFNVLAKPQLLQMPVLWPSPASLPSLPLQPPFPLQPPSEPPFQVLILLVIIVLLLLVFCLFLSQSIGKWDKQWSVDIIPVYLGAISANAELMVEINSANSVHRPDIWLHSC